MPMPTKTGMALVLTAHTTQQATSTFKELLMAYMNVSISASLKVIAIACNV